MAKIQRNTQKIFAGKGTNNPIAVFGSMKTGNPIYTDNIEDLQSTAYENGWADAIVADEAPFLEEMNGVQYGFSKQLAYLFQEGIPEYDAGTTFYKGSIIKALNTDNKPVLYYSLVDDNLNNPLTDNTKWEEITFDTSGGGGLEVCDIGMSLYVDETKGLRRYLNGQVVTINTNTQGFLDRLKQITTLYPSLLTTEENWQAAKTLSAFGQVGKFVFNYAEDGTTVESVRLPRVVNVQGVFDLQNLGLTVDAALPNITGSFLNNGRAYDSADASKYTGAFTRNNSTQNTSNAGASNDGRIINFDASRSSSVYKDGQTTVQQEAIQYPYFIQIATGQETEVNIVNDIELNNPYTLFDSKYADKPLYNASWLVSNGTYYTKAIYVTAYEGLVVEHNTAITAGTTVTLPSGISYTKRGLSVKLSTETYTDYDFVLNTTDETFRCPLKIKELTIVEEYTDGTSWYRVYSDGWCEQGGQRTLDKANAYVAQNLLKKYRNTNYSVTATNAGGSATTTTYNVKVGNEGLNTTDKVYLLCTNANTGVVWRATGYLADSEWTPPYLYFYIGETVQNANLINAGRFAEVKADKTAVDGQWASFSTPITVLTGSMPSQTITFDLSDILPDDGYSYEVFMTGSVFTVASANEQLLIRVASDIIGDITATNVTTMIYFIAVRSIAQSFGGLATGNIILPIGVERKIVLKVEGTIAQGSNVRLLGYRRLGTNV